MSVIQEQIPSEIEFRGTAKEWFGVWLVNLLLSIITLGIYSAWAKVRRKKYFHNNTFIEERNFDYHATGWQILKGRIIVFLGLIAYQILITVNPIIGLLAFVAFLIIYPWLITRALVFNARNTSFSNIRFNFEGKAIGVALVFIIYPILATLTLLTTMPIAERAARRYIINNHRLGISEFNMDAPLRVFYKAFGVAIAWVLFVAAVMYAIKLGVGNGLVFPLNDNQSGNIDFSILIVIYGTFFFGLFPGAVIHEALIRNAIYNNTSLQGGHSFASNIHPMYFLWIAVSNTVVVIFTIGLMLPWAQIRMTRYLAAHTNVTLGSTMDEFIAHEQEGVTAVGDAYVDFDGVDLGLGV